MTRIPREIADAVRDLIDAIGGVGNSRHTHALARAISSSPVREAVEIGIDIFLEDTEKKSA